MIEHGPTLDPFDEQPLTRELLMHELNHNGSAHLFLCGEINEDNKAVSCNDELQADVDMLLAFFDVRPERWYRYVAGGTMFRSPDNELSRNDAERAASNGFRCGEWLHRLTRDDLTMQANATGDVAEVHIDLRLPRSIGLRLTGTAECWNKSETRELGWKMDFTADISYYRYTQSDE